MCVVFVGIVSGWVGYWIILDSKKSYFLENNILEVNSSAFEKRII